MINVGLYYLETQKGPVEGWLKASNALRDLGINLLPRTYNYSNEKLDVLVTQQFNLGMDTNPKTLPPTILLERADSAIAWCRKIASWETIKLILKVGTLRDTSLHNFCYGRYHAAILRKTHIDPRIILNEEILKKYKPGLSYLTYNVMEDFTKQTHTPKTKGVFFAGTTFYPNEECVSSHRNYLCKKLASRFDSTVIRSRALPRKEYLKLLSEHKVAISPWGYGEMAYRDYEAILSGCVLIKPNTDFVLCHPDIMISGKHYVECKPDWSDLNDKINQVLSGWESYTEMRNSSKDLLLKHTDVTEIAKYLKGLIQEALNDPQKKFTDT